MWLLMPPQKADHALCPASTLLVARSCFVIQHSTGGGSAIAGRVASSSSSSMAVVAILRAAGA